MPVTEKPPVFVYNPKEKPSGQPFDEGAFCSAIIVAAGNSLRMGGEKSKVLLEICGIPVIIRSMLPFEHCPLISEIIVSAKAEDIQTIQELAASHGIQKLACVVEGGADRQASVFAAAAKVSKTAQYIAVHDGARPLVSAATVESTIIAAGETGAAVAALKCKETIKEIKKNMTIDYTPNREFLYAAHTPQVFARELFVRAQARAMLDGESYTDDSAMAEAIGASVKIVPDNEHNIKITTPLDLAVAEIILKAASKCEE